MDRSRNSCEQYAIKNQLKFERRRGRQMSDIREYFLREVLPCNPVKFLRSEESVGVEHRIDWYAASEQTAKSPTECRVKWSEFVEYILEHMDNGSRKKEILPGLLQLSGALKQQEKVARRKWTASETQRLVDMVGEMGRRWKKIGRELNRGPRACMQQYYVYQGHSTDPAGEWKLEELQHLYEYLGDKLFWHPVEAARHRGGDRNVLWKDASNITGKSARDCQNMWKRMKAQFLASQQHLKTHDVYKIAERALQSCLVEVKEELIERDAVEDGENDATAPPLADVTPSQLSQCIAILLEQDMLESKRDFDADWLQFNLHKTPSLACASEDIVRHVRRMLRRCKRVGMRARLALEHRTLRDGISHRLSIFLYAAYTSSSLGKLAALRFVLTRSEELLVPSLRFRKLLKKFAKRSEFTLLPRDDASEEPDFVDLRLPSSSE